MENKEKKKVEHVCLTTVRDLGFTDKLIKELLPEPILRANPYNRYYPMKLWDKDVVEEAMETPEFKIYQHQQIVKEASRV